MKKLLMAASLLLLISGCYNDKYDKLYPTNLTTTCDTTTISYAADIKPIIVNSCYSPGNGCHNATGGSGYDFETSIASLQGTAVSGRLVLDINWGSGADNMPKNGTKLSNCDIDKITRWVNQGAQNN